MAKNYISTFFVVFLFVMTPKVFSQNMVYNNTDAIQPKIESLSIYPNPVNNNRQSIFITSKYNRPKHIEFFNAIGKKIYSTNIMGKELNISRLSTGVYFLKITENNISETRKLVIK